MPKRQSAFSKALQEAQKTEKSETPEIKDTTVKDRKEPQNRKTVKNGKTAREKITFYLEPDQSGKLYDLIEEYRKKTGVKINQQAMLRRILEVVNIDTVLP